VIARWKGIVEEIHFGGSIMPSAIIENLYLEKTSFGPSKWPQKLKPAKNSKLPKWPENCFEPFGKGGWPPISTWINFLLKILTKMSKRVNSLSTNAKSSLFHQVFIKTLVTALRELQKPWSWLMQSLNPNTQSNK
jgi:hypothetical protein